MIIFIRPARETKEKEIKGCTKTLLGCLCFCCMHVGLACKLMNNDEKGFVNGGWWVGERTMMATPTLLAFASVIIIIMISRNSYLDDNNDWT